MFKGGIFLISVFLFGLVVAAVPLEKRSSSKSGETERSSKQKEIVERLGGLVTDLLKRPETNEFLSMFKDSNGEYNFDLNMLFENGNILGSTDDKAEEKEAVAEGTGEVVKRSEEIEAKGAGKGNAGGMQGLGDYMKFIPGGMGGGSGDSKSKLIVDFLILYFCITFNRK